MEAIIEKKRVVNLYRVSTDRQGAEDDIPVQRTECTEYANKNEWEIVDEITEKLSGYNTPIEEREALYKIRDMALAGEIDIVLAYMSDRIGRQTELAGYVQGLAMLGVQVWSVKEGLIGGLEHNDNLMTYIKFWMAEGESRKTSTRVKDSMKRMNEDGFYMGGKPPLGYKLEDTGEKINSKKTKTMNKLVIDEEEEIVVKLIFQLIIEKGYGAGRITKHLNDLGYTNRGKIFRHNTISRIMRNPIYMGYKRYNTSEQLMGRTKKRKPTDREDWKVQPFKEELQIIPETLFYRVQDIIDSRVRPKKGASTTVTGKSKVTVPTSSPVLLSGMLVCGTCGHRLKTDYSIKKYTRKSDGVVTKNKVHRYMCHYALNFQDHGKKQWGSKTIDSIVEQQVIETLDQIDLDTLEKGIDAFQQDNLKTKKVELSNLEKIIKKKETAQENTTKELELFMMGESDFTKPQLVTLMNKLSEELMNLKKTRLDIETELQEGEFTLKDIVSFKDRFKNWADVYKTSDLDSKKMMIASVVKEVVLFGDKVQIHFKIGIQEALNKSIGKVDEEEGKVFSGMIKDGELWVSEHGNDQTKFTGLEAMGDQDSDLVGSGVGSRHHPNRHWRPWLHD